MKFLAVLLSLLSFSAFSIDMSVEPSFFLKEIKIEPKQLGTIQEVEFSLTNKTTNTYDLELILDEPKNDEGKVISESTFSSFLKNKNIKITLKPKEVKNLKLFIDIPKDFKGEKMLNFGFEPKKASNGVKMGLNTYMTTYPAIVLSNKEGLAFDAKLDALKLINNKNQQLLKAFISNQGNAFLRKSKATVMIFDSNNKFVSKVELTKEKGSAMLVGDQNMYFGVLPNKLGKGNFKGVIVFSSNDGIFAKKMEMGFKN